MNYYNEFDPKAAAWLRALIAAGHIPPGHVDTRSITEISPHELTGYTQQHFFAGIGGWSLALRLAGWADDRPVRTGSCPCQPFSAAGKGLGPADPRHLWPPFRELIRFGEPTITFGEQVASPAGREWLAGIRADLEEMGHDFGAADLCAAGIAAPQLRQRLYWMANPQGHRRREGRAHERGRVSGSESQNLRSRSSDDCCPARLGDTDRPRPQGRIIDRHGAGQRSPWSASVGVCGNDGTWRRVEPGIPPLAPRLPGRVALIRGSGNAIVPQLAAEFILACEASL